MSQVTQQSEVTPFDNPCVAYLSNEVLDPIFENEVLLKGFKVIWFVINNFFEFFFRLFEITLSQNTTREIGR